MINITEDFINKFTGNASAQSAGKSLAVKNSFQELYISSDDSIIFGSCQGSGKSPYQCSVDFSDPSKPIPRCSCPSRQIPCKHAVGLLYSKMLGKTFKTAEIPEDVLAKRSKAKQRAEKKESKAAEAEVDPKTAEKNVQKLKAAAAKKCRKQLEGIDLAEKILRNIVSAGLHSIDRKNLALYLEQAKQLGNYYIAGVQAALTELVAAASEAQKSKDADFIAAIEAVNYLHALTKRGRSYLEGKAADLEAKEADYKPVSKDASIHSSIEEQLGYAWKLAELKEEGLYIPNAELFQVGFSVITDHARREFVDEGIWFCLTNGEIYLTKNFRPFNALKHVKEEDSFFSVITTEELFIYPGDKNPRVRWDNFIPSRAVAADDLKKAQKAGATDFAQVIKSVKNQIKNPLADKFPIYPLKYSRLGIDAEGGYFIFDEAGVCLPLRIDGAFAHLIKHLSREQVDEGVLIARFEHDLLKQILYAVPTALLTTNEVIRFGY
ncbi:MAG: SWIM zinc finger domain-containing protein [Deferribacteraceae bacterium]|jgi:hypothetical protein|nr:SWIM zinc finger domain-containing protein [Deferribacteraceae bacterium]